jgi:hypothetical protein
MTPPSPESADALDRIMRGGLEVWSNLWFWILIGSTIAVAIGIICEAPEVWQEVGFGRKTVAHIRNFWYIHVRKIDLNGWERICPELVTGKSERHWKWIAKAGFIGWTLVALGVAGEGVAEYFVNTSETDIRSFDEASLSETTRTAGNARVSAEIAANSASRAKQEADQVTGIATAAKAGAADAERQVANLQAQATSLQGYIDAEKEEIVRLKTPRHLTDLDKATKALSAFRGTEYLFSEVAADPDSLALLVQIDGVLQQAGWKRMPPPHTFPEIEVFGGKPEYGVAVSLNAGIQVSTESQNPPTSRAPFSIFDQSISMHERAAGLLMLVFANKMFPPEEHADQKQLTVGPGTSQIVRIAIGRKP